MVGAVSVLLPATPRIPASPVLLRNRPPPAAFPGFPPASRRLGRSLRSLPPQASVGGAEYITEPATTVKFPKELKIPGCSKSLVLLGTGYREKIFAIIGVKVYAAAFYADGFIRDHLDAWRGKSAAAILADSSVFHIVYEAPIEKSLNIMLVRDVDGKTFWNALDDVISSRMDKPKAMDESALSTFRNTFLGRELKQGTCIFLSWVEPSKMLISISAGGMPSSVDAEINSLNVNLALYDGFFGNSPVSPSLKASVGDGLSKILD